MTESVESASGYRLVLFQCRREMLFDVRAVLLQQIILVPVKQHALLNGLQILVRIIAPDYQIPQIAGLHTGLESTFRLRDNIQFYIEFLQHDLAEPANLLTGIVGQLIIHVKGNGLRGNDIRQIHLGRRL